MIRKIPTDGMSRDEWLAERRKSLGGSDMGAVLGLNKYRSQYAVWAEKTGLIGETPDNEAMRQGRDLEDYVAQRFCEKSGKPVQRLNYILRNDDAPYLHASIDRRILKESAGLECKTASALSMKNYAGGEFPESYYAQCVTYLAVTGWKRWYLAALVLNKAFFVYQVTTVPDDECPAWCESSVYVSPDEIAALKCCAADFWTDHVETGEPPAPDGAEGTTEMLETIYAGGGGCVELFGRETALAQYFELTGEKNELETRIETIKQTIMQDMGDAESAECGRYSVSWAAQSRSTFDAKAFAKDHPDADLGKYYKQTTFRRFSIKEDKAS